jgi:hypothetical protein
MYKSRYNSGLTYGAEDDIFKETGFGNNFIIMGEK